MIGAPARPLLIDHRREKMATVVFMGSDEFSVPSLLALTMAHEVAGVITQPDRPAGRGRELTPNPVKMTADTMGLSVFQPPRVSAADAVLQISEWMPDVIVVAAFGQILRRPVLESPPMGCVNVHASLLPRWRGAAPVAHAILAGDEETGVTIIKMDEGLDTGPVLAQESTTIEVDDTAGTLGARLAEMGAQLLVEVLPAYVDGDLEPQAQPEEGVTYAPQVQKADGEIDWSQSAVQIDRMTRAYTPWPSAYTFWEGRRLKILETIPMPEWKGNKAPGTVFVDEVSPVVATGDGAVWVTRLQLEGRKPMSSDHFLLGQGDLIGVVLGK
jgi:methionyl-tRNA formyltransferase